MIDREIAEKNFNVACALYEKSKEIIRELTTYAKMVHSNFSFDIAMKQYDLLLQGILLRVAVEDGYFLEEEQRFVRKLTDYYDIMSYFASKEISISWDIFNNFNNEEQKELSLKMLEALQELANDFITPFAMIDAVLPKDYCEELTNQMGMICLSLAGCDADTTESDAFRAEGAVAVVLIDKLIKEEWRSIESKTNKSSTQSKSQDSVRAHSLKENFLKKKTLM